LVVAGIAYQIEHTVNAGPVVDRDFEPAHYEDYQSYEPWYESCDTDSDGDISCHMNYHFVTRTRWVNDDWSVLVEGHCKTDDGVNMKCDRTWHDVSHGEYDRLQLGEWYGPTPSPTFRY
jgi:hypothetical protein